MPEKTIAASIASAADFSPIFTDQALYLVKTKSFWRAQLPHWEIENGTYFFTIRCHGSLPSDAVGAISEINRSLSAVDPASRDFAQWQRRYFLTLEKYIDQGAGFCPFRNAGCCRAVIEAFKDLAACDWHVRHFVLMPNHFHALVETGPAAAAMKTVWKQWKGRTAHVCNRTLGRRGAFWQRDWFDRWLRDEAERQRTITYIRENPVKASLVNSWTEYPWVR